MSMGDEGTSVEGRVTCDGSGGGALPLGVAGSIGVATRSRAPVPFGRRSWDADGDAIVAAETRLVCVGQINWLGASRFREVGVGGMGR
jgi:hypothetical protein